MTIVYIVIRDLHYVSTTIFDVFSREDDAEAVARYQQGQDKTKGLNSSVYVEAWKVKTTLEGWSHD